MKFLTSLVMAGVAALGGYALYDYYSPDSRRARELHIVDTLKPDVKPQACWPPDPLQKAPISIFGSPVLTVLTRVCICSPCYPP